MINLFSKDIFERDYGGEDLIGRVYEYFIGEFASSEGKRGGEYFTPSSIVHLLVAMLERLMADEIFRRQKNNLTRSKSFRQQLEKTLLDDRLIDAKAVIEQMIAIRRSIESDDQRAKELGLTPEEIAFYDAVAGNFMTIYDQAALRDIVHEVVQTLKRNLKVDWTEPSREEVRAGARSAVKTVLRKKKVREEDLEPFLGSVMVQAQALYAEWPVGVAEA